MVSTNGYRNGDHAPGLRDAAAASAATHHLLLGHGLAVRALRGLAPPRSGSPWTCIRSGCSATTGQASSSGAWWITDAAANGIYLGPVLHGRYPEHAPQALLPPTALIADGDLDIIKRTVDFGVKLDDAGLPARRETRGPQADEEPGPLPVPVVEYLLEDLERTRWAGVDPSGLHQTWSRLSREPACRSSSPRTAARPRTT